MVTVPTMFHGRVAVLPVAAIVAAIGVRVARSKVLAICVRVELRAIARVFDNGLRQRGSCESCRGKSRGPNQCEFHLGLLDSVRSRWERASVPPISFWLALSNVIIRHRKSAAADISATSVVIRQRVAPTVSCAAGHSSAAENQMSPSKVSSDSISADVCYEIPNQATSATVGARFGRAERAPRTTRSLNLSLIRRGSRRVE